MSLNKKIQDLINNRPVYEVSPTVAEDQATANANAFGEDRVLEGERNQLGEETASDIANAEKYSGSANSILATLSSIVGGQQQQSRNLGIAGAQLRNAKLQQKYAADQNAEEAYDKAFNWNVAGKYSDLLNILYQRKRGRQALTNQVIASGTSLLNPYGGNAGAGGTPGGGGATTSEVGVDGKPEMQEAPGNTASSPGAAGGGGGGGAGALAALFA